MTQTYALQAIATRYLGPTNYKGSRVKAYCDAGSITVSWEHALNSFQNHQAAANALLIKLGWETRGLLGGALPKSCRDTYSWNISSVDGFSTTKDDR